MLTFILLKFPAKPKATWFVQTAQVAFTSHSLLLDMAWFSCTITNTTAIAVCCVPMSY